MQNPQLDGPASSGIETCTATSQLGCGAVIITRNVTAVTPKDRIDKECLPDGNCILCGEENEKWLSHLITSPGKVFSYFYLYPFPLLKVLELFKKGTSATKLLKNFKERNRCQARSRFVHLLLGLRTTPGSTFPGLRDTERNTAGRIIHVT